MLLRNALARAILRRLPALALGVLVLALAGCAAEQYPQTTLAPLGEAAKVSDDVFMTTVKWAAIVFVLVEGALLFTIFRFRGRPEDAEPEQIHGNTKLEVVWTAVPAVILAMIAVPTIRAIFHLAETPKGDVLEVEAIGHQWWWEFRYPQLGIVTAGEMHVPVGKTVDVKLSAADVLHSFWIPQFAGKRDVFPKRTTYLWFRADVAGNYTGQCAEFCGEQHGRMGFRVVAQEGGDFDGWVARQTGPAPEVSDSLTPLAARGKQLFVQAGCIGCHAMAGQPTEKLTAMIGPNLSHVGSRGSLAGNMLANTDENLARWIADPQAIKQGSLMKLPRELTADEVQALVAYLRLHQ
jgi:cytochrome c oxidase subunit 2